MTVIKILQATAVSGGRSKQNSPKYSVANHAFLPKNQVSFTRVGAFFTNAKAFLEVPLQKLSFLPDEDSPIE